LNQFKNISFESLLLEKILKNQWENEKIFIKIALIKNIITLISFVEKSRF
jgi:hypothetical protein